MSGLIDSMSPSPTTNVGLSDSSNIPVNIRILMAQKKKNDTPTWSREDAISAISKGFRGMSQAERDSAAAKFDHDAYMKHLDDMGFAIVPKQNTQKQK